MLLGTSASSVAEQIALRMMARRLSIELSRHTKTEQRFKMATLKQFASNMRQMAARIERRAGEIQRLLALDVLRGVVLGTPVGNNQIWLEPDKAPVGYVGGRARANWFVGIGYAPGEVSEEIDASGGVAISGGTAIIADATPSSTIHIVNNLPYIIPLNNGHSRQAPEGFVERAVAQASDAAKNQKVTEG